MDNKKNRRSKISSKKHKIKDLNQNKNANFSEMGMQVGAESWIAKTDEQLKHMTFDSKK